VRFCVPARPIDLYMDKLESLIDTRGTPHAEEQQQQQRQQLTQNARADIERSTVSYCRCQGGGGEYRTTTAAEGARGLGGGNWFSLCLFGKAGSTVSYICRRYVDRRVPRDLWPSRRLSRARTPLRRRGGRRACAYVCAEGRSSKAPRRKTANQSKGQRTARCSSLARAMPDRSLSLKNADEKEGGKN